MKFEIHSEHEDLILKWGEAVEVRLNFVDLARLFSNLSDVSQAHFFLTVVELFEQFDSPTGNGDTQAYSIGMELVRRCEAEEVEQVMEFFDLIRGGVEQATAEKVMES